MFPHPACCAQGLALPADLQALLREGTDLHRSEAAISSVAAAAYLRNPGTSATISAQAAEAEVARLWADVSAEAKAKLSPQAGPALANELQVNISYTAGAE